MILCGTRGAEIPTRIEKSTVRASIGPSLTDRGVPRLIFQMKRIQNRGLKPPYGGRICHFNWNPHFICRILTLLGGRSKKLTVCRLPGDISKISVPNSQKTGDKTLVVTIGRRAAGTGTGYSIPRSFFHRRYASSTAGALSADSRHSGSLMYSGACRMWRARPSHLTS